MFLTLDPGNCIFSFSLLLFSCHHSCMSFLFDIVKTSCVSGTTCGLLPAVTVSLSTWSGPFLPSHRYEYIHFMSKMKLRLVFQVVAETAVSKAFCGSLPNIPSLNVTAPYSFSQTSFSVSAPTSPGTDANYFYRLNITISPPANQVATIHATVGYRFLPGDISILLEAGTKGTHCGNTGTTFSITPPTGCTYGDNLQNVNTLHTFVEPGNYILWIYEPVKQMVNVSTVIPTLSLSLLFLN